MLTWWPLLKVTFTPSGRPSYTKPGTAGMGGISPAASALMSLKVSIYLAVRQFIFGVVVWRERWQCEEVVVV